METLVQWGVCLFFYFNQGDMCIHLSKFKMQLIFKVRGLHWGYINQLNLYPRTCHYSLVTENRRVRSSDWHSSKLKEETLASKGKKQMLITRALSSKIEIEYILFTSDSKIVFVEFVHHWIKKSQLILFVKQNRN